MPDGGCNSIEEDKRVSDSLNSLVIPVELFERMRSTIFRIASSPERHVGTDKCYDVGLCQKSNIDELVKDIQRYNDNREATGQVTNEKEIDEMTKVDQAMKLFRGCSLTYQTVILHATGCGEAHNFTDVRNHFLSLDDNELQCAIEDMIDETVEA